MSKKYCFADIHGNYNLWSQIKNFCGQDDEIYFLGDAADRGPDGIKIILELMRDARVHWICGNHDYYFIEIYKNAETIDERQAIIKEWYQNGGKATHKAFQKLSYQQQKKIINYIDSLPFYLAIYNIKNQLIHLSHAGFSFTSSNESTVLSAYQLIWGREHIGQAWKGNDSDFIIHGHTAAQYIRQQTKAIKGVPMSEPAVYANGHKIDLDCATYATHKIALLNLDTFQSIMFAETPPNQTLNQT